ncbi:MAG: LysE family translocator [Roseiarcus sp.]|jgi:threonine/homoserine/homoserine lactone efflux protein
MSPHLYAAFVLTSVALILIPGPNVALIAANSLAHGPRYGLLTVAGTSSAMVAQLTLTVLGMTTFLAELAGWFEAVRWVGVAYLLYLGIKAWRAPARFSAAGPEARSIRAIYLRGFFVSLTNPKTLLFYGAFLPQFVAPAAGAPRQLAILATTFLVIALLLDGAWALLAARFGRALAVNAKLRNRLTAIVLAGAGAGLALARKP